MDCIECRWPWKRPVDRRWQYRESHSWKRRQGVIRIRRPSDAADMVERGRPSAAGLGSKSLLDSAEGKTEYAECSPRASILSEHVASSCRGLHVDPRSVERAWPALHGCRFEKSAVAGQRSRNGSYPRKTVGTRGGLAQGRK
jgi:hypothetical protein